MMTKGEGSTTLKLSTTKSSTTTKNPFTTTTTTTTERSSTITTVESGSITTEPVCELDATAITFDDIPSADPAQAELPTNYAGLRWTNGYYINISTYPNSGY
ncbi:unnamed protein product, partial [Adineta steineri]